MNELACRPEESNLDHFEDPGPDVDYSVLFDRPKSFQPKELSPRQQQIVRFHALGMRNIDIARRLGVTPVTVSNIIRSVLGKEELEKLREAADQEASSAYIQMVRSASVAVDALEQVIEDGEADTGARVRAAIALLDRAGLSPVRKTDVQVTDNKHITIEDIDGMKKRLEQARRETTVIEVS